LSTLLTVAIDTPALRATSLMLLAAIRRFVPLLSRLLSQQMRRDG